MKILVAGSVNEYSCYEEEQLVKAIAERLKIEGHKVDYFLLPYKPDSLSLLDQVLAYRLIDVSEAEMLITIGYPACFIEHVNKICYLLETAPMLHEYWDSEYGIRGNYQYSQILITVNSIEKKCFLDAKRILANSSLLCKDIFKRTGVNTELLFLPYLEAKETYGKNEGGRYFVVETNLLQNSRYYEFLEQIPHLKNAKIYICIPNADLVYRHALDDQIKRLNLYEKIVIIKGQPSDALLINSLGYLHFCFGSRRFDNIINRCMALGTPVILTDDCGAALEYTTKYSGADIARFDKLVSKLNNFGFKQGKSYKLNINDFVDQLIKEKNNIF